MVTVIVPFLLMMIVSWLCGSGSLSPLSFYLSLSPSPPTLPLSFSLPLYDSLYLSVSLSISPSLTWLFCLPIVQFVPKTHLVFSVSKDRTLKCWDADNFEHIQTLQVSLCVQFFCLLVTYDHGCRVYRGIKRKSGHWLSAVMATLW